MTSTRSSILRRSGAGVLVTGLAVALLCSGCTSNGQARHTPSGAAPTASPSEDPAAQARAAAIEAYKGMWDAFAEAGETADQKSPKIRRYATGNARTRIVAALLGYRDQGVVTRGRLEMSPEVKSLNPASSPSSAEVVDCADSTGWVKQDAKSGRPIKEPAGKRKITATVVVDDGAWKVSDFKAEEIGSCD